MLGEDFLTHRKAQPGAAALLRRKERTEKLLHLVRRDAGAIVLHFDLDQPLGNQIPGANPHASARPLLSRGRVNRVGHHVEHRAVNPLGVENEVGHRLARLPVERDARLLGAGLHQLDHVADHVV